MRTSHYLVLLCFATLACAARPFAVAAQDAPLPLAPIDLKFDFGAGPAKAGYIRVAPTAVYTDDSGFGYEPGAQVASGDGGKTTTSDRSFMFSVKVPEGNYNVTITIGDSHEVTTTTVKAESGRLMLERVEVPAGKVMDRTFTTNVRTPTTAKTAVERSGTRRSEPGPV